MQMAYDAEKARLEKLESGRELKEAMEQDTAYQARVREASKYTPPSFYGRPKVQWFY
jgi:hypothetical protein